MKAGLKKISRIRTYSIQAFIKRVIITLTALVAVSSTVIFLLVYLPLKAELEKSLMDNFGQLSYIRYVSLQNSINRGLEGAKTISSRNVIRNAILEYENSAISMDELRAATQSMYEEGAKALCYLIKAERMVGYSLIAGYISNDYEDHSCATDDRLVKGNKVSTALCLTDDHEYFVVLSPIVWQKRVLGYDRIVFDLSDQIHMLGTDTIKSELIYDDAFMDLISGADMIQSGDASSVFYKQGFYYQTFNMQDNTHFVTRQNAGSLLDPVHQLSKQTLLRGIGVLLAFTAAVYFLIIQFATNELVNLEYSRRSLKEAVAEANLDPLTKAGGRSFGEKFLASAFKSFQKGEPSPAIIMFDIDFLKQINDTHGHSAGDRVIRCIAKAVQMNIRSGDTLLRWGGDEFVGVFSGLSKENILPFAQKLLSAVADLTVEIDAEPIYPTISMGISYFQAEDRGFFDAINRADRAMYQSKIEGRNRVHQL